MDNGVRILIKVCFTFIYVQHCDALDPAVENGQNSVPQPDYLTHQSSDNPFHDSSATIGAAPSASVTPVHSQKNSHYARLSRHRKIAQSNLSPENFSLNHTANVSHAKQNPFQAVDPPRDMLNGVVTNLSDIASAVLDQSEDNSVEETPAPANLEALETGDEAHHIEQKSSTKIFFILGILGVAIIFIHFLTKYHLHYFPESLAVMMLGGIVAFGLKVVNANDWLEAEFLNPGTFFLVLLPPIILEAGYNLHKGNFFANIGSIMVFAVLGTIISTVIVGGGIYAISITTSEYDLTLPEAFAYGSLVSAVDPVATIAIFSAMNVDPLLNMLVFGESILNDAVSIVLTNILIKKSSWEGDGIIGTITGEFVRMFAFSASLGVTTGILSALLLKHIDLRRTPSLELALMLVFCYVPYGIAEATGLSGIMALLFSGIVMSHYTHHNLSLVTQINLQHTLRTLAFMSETTVFAYIGMAMFSIKHNFQPSFCFGTVFLTLIGRAANIFPLSMLVNKFRVVKINKRMQFVMWFSGLRGAIAYVLSLHLEMDSLVKRHIVITGTLTEVLFTIIFLGGATFPLIKFLKITGDTRHRNSSPGNAPKKRTQNELPVTLSKTVQGSALAESDYASSLAYSNSDEYDTPEEQTTLGECITLVPDDNNNNSPRVKRLRKKRNEGRNENPPPTYFASSFIRLDTQILVPFLCRRVTREELISNRTQMRQFASRWYDEVRTKKPGQWVTFESTEKLI